MPTDPKQPKKLRRPSGTSHARAKPTVLVVDDDATIRVLVRRMLEEADHQVTEAESGRDALVRLRAAPLPDYLITDLKMADGSGGWLVSQVGYEFPTLLARTVVITGDATGAAAAHVAARWRCPVVPKPLTSAGVLGALRRLDDAPMDR
jgi:two-component system cell cycle sensor histidine kinase/response regulator CckA